jgi:ParB family chromosome partitioning protein
MSRRIRTKVSYISPGIIDLLEISKIRLPKKTIRLKPNRVEELAWSIKEKGLLQPIIVRPIGGGIFEIVAGHRRYLACQLLRWRKIPCNIIMLDDKTAFEASLIENIQRNNMDALEEAEAYRRYVEEYGWGSVTDLAKKIGKSAPYISKRISILNLPQDVLEKIRHNNISPSAAEELINLNEKGEQSKLARLISTRHLSISKTRKLIVDGHLSGSLSDLSTSIESYERIFDKMIISLRLCMDRVAAMAEDTQDNWFLREILLSYRNTLHTQIDLLMKQKKQLRKCYRHTL